MSRENLIGEPFIELSEVDSSNNYAMRQIQAHLAEHGTTWFAHQQNAGKGQRGKSWKTETGKNIILSTIIEPTSILQGNHFGLSIMVALSCYDFFSKYAVDAIAIKWPNDIYWKDRKAGGILIENIINGGNWRFAVVGIGINVNQTLFSEELVNPVSLKQITGNSYNVVDLAKELCTCIEKRWQQLQTISYNNLLEDYCSHLYKRGEEVTFRKDNVLFKATVREVNANGDLVIDRGVETKVNFGSLDWVIN